MTSLEEEKNSQCGHRRRVRDLVNKNGVGGFPEYMVLEYILFYGIPRRDTKRIARQLLEKYHNLATIVKTDIDSLAKNPYMTQTAAELLHALPSILIYLDEQDIRPERLQSVRQCVEYLKARIPLEKEAAFILCLDKNNRILAVERIATGTTDEARIILKNIIAPILKNESHRAIIVHNHPLSDAKPSQDDLIATKDLQDCLASAGIELVDHVVIGKDNTLFSIRKGAYI